MCKTRHRNYNDKAENYISEVVLTFSSVVLFKRSARTVIRENKMQKTNYLH